MLLQAVEVSRIWGLQHLVWCHPHVTCLGQPGLEQSCEQRRHIARSGWKDPWTQVKKRTLRDRKRLFLWSWHYSTWCSTCFQFLSLILDKNVIFFSFLSKRGWTDPLWSLLLSCPCISPLTMVVTDPWGISDPWGITHLLCVPSRWRESCGVLCSVQFVFVARAVWSKLCFCSAAAWGDCQRGVTCEGRFSESQSVWHQSHGGSCCSLLSQGSVKPEELE